LAVDLEQRYPEKDIIEQLLARANASGKCLNSYVDRLNYAETEVERLLKGRSPYLAIEGFPQRVYPCRQTEAGKAAHGLSQDASPLQGGMFKMRPAALGLGCAKAGHAECTNFIRDMRPGNAYKQSLSAALNFETDSVPSI
jgi:hypothetical protein